MTTVETISLISAIASLILAILAIVLSIVFFRMSSELSRHTEEAAKGIGASVERLEKLFDKLYADTFSMMRDTVSDMRKHIWPDDSADSEKVADEAEKRAEKKVAEVKKKIDEDLSSVLQQQQITDDRLGDLQSEMRGLIERAIHDSRRVEEEAREETVRRHILRRLRLRRSGEASAESLVDRLKLPPHRVIQELEQMAEEGIIEISDEDIGPSTMIRYIRRSERG